MRDVYIVHLWMADAWVWIPVCGGMGMAAVLDPLFPSPSPVLICRCESRWVMRVYLDVQDVCFLVCVDVEDVWPVVVKRVVDAGIGDRGSRIRFRDAGSGMARRRYGFE